MVDMNRCPQTDDEFREYFYALIGRTMGASANDFTTVLSKQYPWKDKMLTIPIGVGPGVTLPSDAPFFGLTQQLSGGVPKARVFLPTAQADENNYYTRCDQYVDDAPNGQGLVWAWYWVAGHEYVPLLPANGQPGPNPNPDPGGGMTEAQVQAMIDAAVAPLKVQIAAAAKVGDKIALRTNSGQIMGIQGGGPPAPDRPIHLISKTDIHSWESFTLERGEG